MVVDTACLKDPKRGVKEIEWLRELGHQQKIARNASTFRSYSWRLSQDWDFLELQAQLEREPCVELASPEGRFYIHGGTFNDPFIKDQTHLASLRYEDALPTFFVPLLLRMPVTIAVVDTGVDFSHPELRSNQWTNRGEIPGNGIDDDQNGYIDDVHGYNFSSNVGDPGPQGDWPENRHGTHVAGLAAARPDNGIGGIGISGVAKLMSLNVFGANGFTRSSTLENAIRYAADRGANIINLSLGGREYSRSMRTALNYAIGKGALIVSAAGNDGIEICDDPTSFDFVSPAVYGSTMDGMIVTGSVDAMSGRMSLFSNFSQRLVEIAAPGALISDGQLLGLLSTTPNNTYGFLAGTSMSAPVLSGAAALVITYLQAYRYPFSPARLEAILKEAARKDSTMAATIQEGRTLDLKSLADYLKRNYPSQPSNRVPANQVAGSGSQ